MAEALVFRYWIGFVVELIFDAVPLIGRAVAEVFDAVSIESGFRFSEGGELFDGFEHGDAIDE